MHPLHDPIRLSATIGRIYDCIRRPDGWQAVFAELADTIDATRAVLGVGTPTRQIGGLAVAIGMERWSDDTALRLAPYNPMLPMLMWWPIDRALVASRDYGLERLRATRFHREWLSVQGDLDCIGFVLTREADLAGSWVLITPASRGPLQPDEIDALELVAPHMRRAIEISNVLGAQQIAAGTYREALARVDAAVLIVDAAARPTFLNGRAERLIDRGDLLRIRRDGVLSGATDTLDRALREAVGGSARTGGVEVSFVGERDEWLMFAVSIDIGADVPFGASERSTMLVLRSPREDTRNPVAIAARTFGLTPTQVQVLALLVQGSTPEQIADAMGVSISTVRTHLVELFRRSGTTRQPELVARALSLASPLDIGAPAPRDGSI